MKCKDCKKCIWYNKKIPDECEWAKYTSKIGKPPNGGECLFLVFK